MVTYTSSRTMKQEPTTTESYHLRKSRPFKDRVFEDPHDALGTTKKTEESR